MPAEPRPPSHPLVAPGTPVLRRGGGQVQLGLDAEAAVVLAARVAERLLPRLDGHTSRAELRLRATQDGFSPADVDAVLDALHEAGLLRSGLLAGPGPPEAARAVVDPPAVRLVGLGPVGQQVARLLLAEGLTLYVTGLDRGRPAGPAPVLLRDLEDLPRRRGARLHVVNHWTKPEHTVPAVTVVAADTVEPDRLVSDGLLRAGHPHLLVRGHGSGVTVGPLVLPGRTACLRCCDLSRRDRDPEWPALLAQLTSLRLPTSAALAAWAAAVAAAQVLAHLQGAAPETAGATLELSGHDYGMRWRAWPLHTACGCAWAVPPQWAP